MYMFKQETMRRSPGPKCIPDRTILSFNCPGCFSL